MIKKYFQLNIYLLGSIVEVCKTEIAHNFITQLDGIFRNGWFRINNIWVFEEESLGLMDTKQGYCLHWENIK